jgi:hypothetical protein
MGKWKIAGGLACGLMMVLLALGAVADEHQEIPPAGLLPDLQNIIPHHLHIQEAQKQHRLVFTVGLANAGEGPLELEPVADLNDATLLIDANQNIYDAATNAGNIVGQNSLLGAFHFHPEHNHWHLDAVNGFEVRRALDDGSGGLWQNETVGQSVKETFCLIDYVQMNDAQLAAFGIPSVRREYWDCFGVQGVSVGWIDYYHHSTHGQFVDITGAPTGIYYLILTANPDGLFIESDYTNNRAWVSFSLSYNKRNNAILKVLFNSLTQAGEGLAPPSKTNR